MLLILRSSAAFSLLNGSFGSFRFFSDGTWSARGWRCPIGASIGASRTIGGFLAAGGDPPVPVCANADGPPTRVSSAIVVISFRILILLTSKRNVTSKRNASIAPARESRSLRNCGAPGPRSPEPSVYRPWCRATTLPPPPAPQRNRASPHSRGCGYLDPPAAPALLLSSVDHGSGG